MAKKTKNKSVPVITPVRVESVDDVSGPDIHNGKYFFFYKSKLSNWHMKEFKVWNTTFNCGEQAMMWFKARVFKDLETAARIMKETDPKEMQLLGRQVKNYNEKLWVLVRDRALDSISMARFTQIDYLKELLLSTGDKILVEASPIDSIWGIGLSVSDAKITPDSEWPGQNRLGLCFTRTKQRIKFQLTDIKEPDTIPAP